ncbi:MAG: leucine-rich repeat domain-containing protein [bacterium]|nr:leucine-rich repeat domain-containing protein [bacterium]
MRNKILLLITLFTGMLLFISCSGVKISLKTADKDYSVVCSHYAVMIKEIEIEKAQKEKPGLELLPFDAAQGDLLSVKLNPISSGKRISFPYIYNGSEGSPFTFRVKESMPYINGKPVYCNLIDTGALEWLEKQPAAVIKNLHSVRLSGNIETDKKALSALAKSNVIIVITKGYSLEDQEEIIRALIAVEPVGIMIKSHDTKGYLSVLKRFKNIKHLFIPGGQISHIQELSQLETLIFDSNGYKPETLDELKIFPRLRGLMLDNCKHITDFSALASLPNLRRLSLDDAKKIKDLSTLSGLTKLEALVLMDTDSLEDISHISKLRNLKSLLIDIRSVKDLTPLMKLKKLKLLLIDKKDLKKRREKFDMIQKALPNCKIIGFCMGSAWIILIFICALVIGLAFRKKWRAVY